MENNKNYKKFIEVVFYPDWACYYNYMGESYDMQDLSELKKELKEKFNYDFVKSKLKIVSGWTLWKVYYHIDL